MADGSKNPSKNPRFFCERCGTEVPADAKSCVECGRVFASVRCPICDFIGEAAAFKGGCPMCGYSSAGQSAAGGVAAASAATSPAAASAKGASAAEDKKSGQKQKRRSRTPSPAESLPAWFYILIVAIFTGVLAALFFAFF